MEAQVRVTGGSSVADTASLYEWLRSDRTLAGAVRAVSRPPAEEEMGGAVDMLVVALGSGGVGVALAQALPAWLQSRRTDVTVTVTSGDKSVTLEAKRIKDAELRPVLEEVLRQHDGR
ncbi:effector-associated constant component EACC1 [Sphaerisporangium sp. NPDC004334]